MIYQLSRICSAELLLIAILSLWGKSLEAQSVYRGAKNIEVNRLEERINAIHGQGQSGNSEYLQVLYSLGIAYSDGGKHIQARDSLAKAVELKANLSGSQDSVYH